MIESAGNLQNNAVNRNTRQKIEDAKADGKGKESTVAGSDSKSPVDELSISSRQAAQAEDARPKQDPLDSADEAEELVANFASLFSGNNDEAQFAQANLDPDKVLELIA